MPERATPRVVAYVPDLMDRSKVAAAAPGARFVAGSADLADAAREADIVVVDAGRPGVLDAVRGIGARTVAFARHTDVDTIAAFREAGCDVVVRSQFFLHLEEYLR